jgi:8-oxo-dGTP pyrophosphatase MutT (NUDIX family)
MLNAVAARLRGSSAGGSRSAPEVHRLIQADNFLALVAPVGGEEKLDEAKSAIFTPLGNAVKECKLSQKSPESLFEIPHVGTGEGLILYGSPTDHSRRFALAMENASYSLGLIKFENLSELEVIKDKYSYKWIVEQLSTAPVGEESATEPLPIVCIYTKSEEGEENILSCGEDGIVSGIPSSQAFGKTTWIVTNCSFDLKCPYDGCSRSGMDEHELCRHCEMDHGNENVLQCCPICKSKRPLGSRTWGFSTHLQHNHGPRFRVLEKPHSKESESVYCFALVICVNNKGEFLLVEECCKQGWWLPGGRVDPGESFETAATRETLEEAGVEVDLTGILRIEFSPHKHGSRQRIIFAAKPKNPNAAPKSYADYESLRAVWISFEEFQNKVKSGEMKLRGGEPMEWFDYVHRGGTIFPITILTTERDPVKFQ